MCGVKHRALRTVRQCSPLSGPTPVSGVTLSPSLKVPCKPCVILFVVVFTRTRGCVFLPWVQQRVQGIKEQAQVPVEALQAQRYEP